MGEEDVPLPSLFEQARALHFIASTSQLELEQLQKACRLLEQCEERIEKLAIFSANEDKEDISTADLKYLLVPYYLGDLIEKLPSLDRLQTIKVSKVHLLTFVRYCDHLELVPEGEVEGLSRESLPKADRRRSEKVARFKRQKEAESRIREIMERKAHRRLSLKATVRVSVEHGEEDISDGDDEEREARLAQISVSLCKTFDLLGMLKKEEDMLIAVQQSIAKGGEDLLSKKLLDDRHSRAETWHKEAASKSRIHQTKQTSSVFAQDVIEGRASNSKGQHNSPLFVPSSVISRGLTTDRQRMVAEVFQPSHRLPTMSIEEAGLKEMQIMKKWTEQNAKFQEDEANSSWVGKSKKDDDSDDEAAEDKARAWDDWKDDNPRGAGNSKLTPCG